MICFFTFLCRYLEEELIYIRDPLEMAIVAYALSLADSVSRESAFIALDSMKRSESE